MLILASSSPRRKELLSKITTSFVVFLPNIDEELIQPYLSSYGISYDESRIKAYMVRSFYPNDEILAADTTVICDGKSLGKPKDRNDAIAMLENESGKRLIVLTSYTYLSPKVEISRTVKSYVYFNELTHDQIVEYVDKFEPFDKAGAFGIQDDFPLIDHIEGSYDNIKGLPTEDLRKFVFRN